MRHFLRSPSVLVLFLVLMVTLFTGCRRATERSPEEIQVITGDAQTGRAGESCAGPVKLRIVSLGENRKHPQPVADARVVVTPETAGASLEGMTNGALELRSDEGGVVQFRITLARTFGDQYFRVVCPDHPAVPPLFLRALAGVEILHDRQQVMAGHHLPHPMELTVTDENGVPQEGVPVFFTLQGSPEGASLENTRVLTDAAGKARTGLQTAPHRTAVYEVLAEIGEGSRRIRGISITQLGVDWLGILLGVLGGLGFFIFGMTLMSGGLQRAAGDRLKNLLQMCTGNRFKAMLAGVLVTALVQSSSACSVMVIGFVNAALLNLTQAIGIILGSSIGTTLTAQIISFKLDFLAMPAIAAGVLWVLVAKNPQRKAVAETLLGFGILFYGMTLMSSQLKGLAQAPAFIAFFQRFDCMPVAGGYPPFLCVLGALVVGTVMTMIVQSSAATIGIAIALAECGLLNFYTAVPLILGDNIGTTITGLLAAMNASSASRQTAVANTIFKVLGAIIMLPLFYVPWNGRPCFLELVDVVTAGDVFAAVPENIGRHMAAAHTLFNICNVALFLPLVQLLSWLSRCLVPNASGKEQEDVPLVHLEMRLLNTPSAALTQVHVALITMEDAAMQLTTEALYAVRCPDEARPKEEVDRLEQRIDNAQHAIIDYLVALTQHSLNASQANAIPLFMHCVNDIERIGDRACNIFELVPKLKENRFSEDAVKDIAEIDELLQYMNVSLLRGLRHNDMEAIQKVLKLDGEAKHMTVRLEQGHEKRLQANDCSVEKGLLYIEVLANLERISSHLTNVADRAPQLLPHSVSFGA